MRHLTTMEKLAAISVGDIEDNLDLYMADADEEPVRRDIDQAVKSRFSLRNPAVAPLAGAAIGGIAGAGLGALSNAGNKYPDKVLPALHGVVGGLAGLGVGGAINAGSKASAIDEVSKKYVRRSDNARQLMMKRKEEDRAYDKEMYSKSLDLQSRGLDRAALLGGIGLAANAYASRGNNEKTASWGRETYGKAVDALKNRANDVSGSAKTQYSNAATKLRSYADKTKKYTKTQYESGSAKAKEYADKITGAYKAKYNQAEEFAKNKYNQANDYARAQKEKASPKTSGYAGKINDWKKRRVDGTKTYYNNLTGKNYRKYTADPDYLKYPPESQAAADKAKSDMWKARGYTALGVGALGGGGYGVHALAKRDNEKNT